MTKLIAISHGPMQIATEYDKRTAYLTIKTEQYFCTLCTCIFHPLTF